MGSPGSNRRGGWFTSIGEPSPVSEPTDDPTMAMATDLVTGVLPRYRSGGQTPRIVTNGTHGPSVNRMSPAAKRHSSSFVATLLNGTVFLGNQLDLSGETCRGGWVRGVTRWWPRVALGVGGAVSHRTIHEQLVPESDALARVTVLRV